MTNVQKTPPPATPETPTTPPADFRPELPAQPSARELELEALVKQAEIDKQDQLEKLKELKATAAGLQMVRDENERLKSENADLKELPTDQAAAAAQKLKKGFTVPTGEEGYTHVLETQVNGEVVEPRIRAYEPHQYETLISKQAGYKGDIIHKGKE